MTIPVEKVATVRAADILATARRFTTLKREGSNEHVGPCPRCGGRDRFGVNTRKRVFNCRGCGARGDVIALVMIAQGVSFAEAVAELAGQATVANWQRRVPHPSPDEDAECKRREAMRIFDGAGPVVASLAER
jgi:DNA primase